MKNQKLAILKWERTVLTLELLMLVTALCFMRQLTAVSAYYIIWLHLKYNNAKYYIRALLTNN